MTDDNRTDADDTEGESRRRASLSRRKLLAATGVAGAGSLAGCFGLFGGDGGNGGKGATVKLSKFRGSGPLVRQRGTPGGTSITEMPDLEGELNFYLGGGEGGLYLDLIELFAQIYPNFSYHKRLDASRTLANRIVEEVQAGASPADVFIAVDAGSLGYVADQGAATTLPSEIRNFVPSEFSTENWVGIAGRARAVPYNTNQFSESDIPNKVQEFPGKAAFENNIGWAPTYGAFQSFITAMRLLRGEEQTRQWLNDMQAIGTKRYPDEFLTSNAVASGEIGAGFANHYYALRVKNQRPDAPLDLAFTENDAGALVNVSGAEVIKGTQNEELAQNFVRHLLSSEAQEFFATQTFAYPTVPEVKPVGPLPSISELNPPEIDLRKLSETGPTIELMEETGVL